MSTLSQPSADWDTVPVGTEWPGPDTVVLLHRPLRPGTNSLALSRFAEDRWNVDPAIFEEHANAKSLNFATIPRPLRQDAKHYIWQLINHPSPGSMRHSGGGRPAIATILTVFSAFKAFMAWLHRQGITAFAQVTPALLDAYRLDLEDEHVSMWPKYRRAGEVRRLWSTRGILPARMRLPALPPWDGEESRDLFGRIRPDRDNRTPRIGELTMQHLLSWAIRFTEEFADDIVAAHAEYEESRLRQPSGAPQSPEKIRTRMTAYLDRLREQGGMLPGRTTADGALVINWRHIGRILGCDSSVRLTASGRMAAKSGITIADGAYLSTPVTGRLDGLLWREHGIAFHEAPRLARLLSTACFVVIAYLSGARPGEVLNLRRGCVEHDSANDLWLMNGRHHKNAVDTDGNKLPAGAPRRDPWVVVEPVARAVTVLESLHPHPLLFPNRITPHQEHLRHTKRRGQARTDGHIARDLAKFVTWVNKECQRLGRTDVIPRDQRGLLTPSRFRRSLAWFIRRRPRGLVAASIQYGHLHTRMLQGY
ncbi:hypothetical protein, partial [Streptomyces caeruleatus]